MKETIGTCAFCMQGRMVEIPEEDWEQYGQMAADDEATRTCNCNEGKSARERLKAFGICEQNIMEMIAPKWPEVADLLSEAKSLVWNESKIRKIRIELPGGEGTIIFTHGKTGLKIEHAKTLRTELSTGY